MHKLITPSQIYYGLFGTTEVINFVFNIEFDPKQIETTSFSFVVVVVDEKQRKKSIHATIE